MAQDRVAFVTNSVAVCYHSVKLTRVSSHLLFPFHGSEISQTDKKHSSKISKLELQLFFVPLTI
jgi:hypothetical protein